MVAFCLNGFPGKYLVGDLGGLSVDYLRCLGSLGRKSEKLEESEEWVVVRHARPARRSADMYI